MRVLITGASGLIGGRLIRSLLEAGDVHVRAASRIERAWPDGVEACVADLARHETLLTACAQMDVVVNLSLMPERACSTHPQAALSFNGGGTMALALAASSARVPRFVQVSTYKVYGNNPRGLVTEDTLCKPESDYAITHRVAEDYVALRHPNSVIFRLANGFGAPAESSTNCWEIIVNELCRQAVADRQVTIRSSGQAWRNFVPMSHVVQALRAATADLPRGTYNLGSEESLPLRALAERVAKICHKTLGFCPAVVLGQAMDGEQFVPLDFRSEKLTNLGFTSVASFDEEVTKTLLAAQEVFGRAEHG